MYRGTNPILVINFSCDASRITKFRVTFVQGKEIVLEKTLSDCTIEDNKIKLQLTEAETFNFKVGVLKMQAKVQMEDGSISYSNVKEIAVKDVLNGGAFDE